MSNRSWILLFTLGLIWGGSFLSTAYGLDAVSFTRLVAYRVGIGALALWFIVLIRRRPTGLKPKHILPLILIGLFNNALPFALIAWGQTTVPSGLAGILNASTAMTTTLLAALVLASDKLTAQKLGGITLGLIGVSVTIGLHNLSSLGIQEMGQFAILLAGLCYAIGTISARVYLADISPTAAAAGMLTGASLFMVTATLLIDGLPKTSIPPANLIAILYTGLIATGLAYYIYFIILRSDGAGSVQLVTLIVPAVAVALGALTRGEELPLRAYIGFAIIASGLLVIDGRIFKRKPRIPKTPPTP